jgi:hypothetical protein
MTPAGGNTPVGLDPGESLYWCTDCGRSVSRSELVIDRRVKSLGGVRRRCRSCDQARARDYYRRNRERVRVRQRAAAGKPAVRLCAWDGCELATITTRNMYCSAHRLEAKDRRLQRRGEMDVFALARARELDAIRDARRRAAGKSRRYPSSHPRLRKDWEPRVASGSCPCARCGLPILPGQDWDLGHDDLDRSRYAGPEHRYSSDCPEGGNRATSRHRVERMRAGL